ncbi:MAG: WXG100 family type VII secretion target [Gracilibacteraceae bacterium]|jgi:WXG100 family type VII secretion target|nr:WXG100 family type VII secretion target [Gracilibacteraceae bacterium]
MAYADGAMSMDPGEARFAADRMDEYAGEADSIVDRMHALVNFGIGSWTGDSKDSFVERSAELHQELRKFSQFTSEEAIVLRGVATTKEEEEKELARKLRGA